MIITTSNDSREFGKRLAREISISGPAEAYGILSPIESKQQIVGRQITVIIRELNCIFL
jgi:hypothetical protein